MSVKITMIYDPEPHEVDNDDDSGLTEEAYMSLMGRLQGFDDVQMEKCDD